MKPAYTLRRIIFAVTISLASVITSNQPSWSQQKLCSIINEGNTTCWELTNTKKDFRISQSNQAQEIQQYVVSLKDCSRQSGNIKCNFTIINNKAGKERSLLLDNNGPKSRSLIIDVSGKSHFSSRLIFGEDSFDNGGRATLFPDVEYAASIVFPGVSGSKFQLLRVGLGVVGETSVVFRNVPIAN
jgi:hypothetical protein